MSCKVKASELQSFVVMRSDAQKFSNAIRESISNLPETAIIVSQQFSTYYDPVRKAPVYSCLISFYEEDTDELVDLNETVSPENSSCTCGGNCKCKNHDNVVDTSSDTASGNDSVMEDEG